MLLVEAWTVSVDGQVLSSLWYSIPLCAAACLAANAKPTALV